MATTGYDDRILLVEVSGLRQQDVMPTSHYTFKVPYRSLARTLQFISRKGGKIVRIHALSLSLPTQELWNSAPLEDLKVEEIEAQPSPTFEADLEQSSPPEASESTPQPSVVTATEEIASPPMVESTEPSSKPPGLIKLLAEKLQSLVRENPAG